MYLIVNLEFIPKKKSSINLLFTKSELDIFVIIQAFRSLRKHGFSEKTLNKKSHS